MGQMKNIKLHIVTDIKNKMTQNNIPHSTPHIRFEVEKVIGISSDGNYQVQWAPAWVSKFHLIGCEHLIQEFLQQQQLKQQHQQQQKPQQQQQQQQTLHQQQQQTLQQQQQQQQIKLKEHQDTCFERTVSLDSGSTLYSSKPVHHEPIDGNHKQIIMRKLRAA